MNKYYLLPILNSARNEFIFKQTAEQNINHFFPLVVVPFHRIDAHLIVFSFLHDEDDKYRGGFRMLICIERHLLCHRSVPHVLDRRRQPLCKNALC